MYLAVNLYQYPRFDWGLQNAFVFLPCKAIKMKLLSWHILLALLLLYRNNRRANIDVGKGYHVITLRWIFTTWRKVALDGL